MDRSIKLVVISWAVVALVVELWLLRGAWASLPLIGFAAFVGAAVMTTIDRRLVALVLVFAYVFPAAIKLTHGPYIAHFGVLWMAGLLGAMVPDGVRRPWHIPARWRPPLVYWALVVAVSSVIVAWRELDFNLATLAEPHMANSSSGGGPGFVITWMLYVALGSVVGILWFDWLFGSGLPFGDAVAAPLLLSAVVMSLVSVYQVVVDLQFLNDTVFGATGRASGTMLDANLTGAAAALWTGGIVLWTQVVGARHAIVRPVGAALVGLLLLAVWASGSRTALGSAVVVGAFVLWGACANRASWGVRPPTAALAIVALLLLGVGIGWLIAAVNPAVVGPMQRARAEWPSLSVASVEATAVELWNRNRYGPVAVAMIRDSPWFGVGTGMFHILVADVALRISNGVPLTPDNAQNWYRHQLAELGLVGSLGWIVWVVSFGWFALRSRITPSLAGWAGRGVLVAFAFVSLVGMPAQDVAIAITFWTMAFWFTLSGPARKVDEPTTTRSVVGWRWWSVVATLVAVFALGSAQLASTALRVPNRATRAGWAYGYGFYEPEPDGAGGQYRWAKRRAVTLVEVAGPWLEVTLSANHLDLGARPLDARVWLDGTLVVETRLATSEPVTRQLRIPSGRSRVVLDTWASRAVRPRDFGVADARELGIMVAWRFLENSSRGPTGR